MAWNVRRVRDRDLVHRFVFVMRDAWESATPGSEAAARRRWVREFDLRRVELESLVAEVVARGMSYYGDSDAVRTLRWVGNTMLERWGRTVVERVTLPLAGKHDLQFAWARLPYHWERVVQFMVRTVLSWGGLVRAAGLHEVPWRERSGAPGGNVMVPSPAGDFWWRQALDRLFRE